MAILQNFSWLNVGTLAMWFWNKNVICKTFCCLFCYLSCWNCCIIMTDRNEYKKLCIKNVPKNCITSFICVAFDNINFSRSFTKNITYFSLTTTLRGRKVLRFVGCIFGKFNIFEVFLLYFFKYVLFNSD